jgi:hypothetical protein
MADSFRLSLRMETSPLEKFLLMVVVARESQPRPGKAETGAPAELQELVGMVAKVAMPAVVASLR